MDLKPHPEHVAQVCRQGHLVLSSLQQFPQFRKAFCEDCGSPTISQCQGCKWPIAGRGPNSWMAGTGPYRPPKFCGECGKPFPWTEKALVAAKEYTDDLDQLSTEEKTTLKGTFDDLATDTVRTPVAANRFNKFLCKIGPAAGTVVVLAKSDLIDKLGVVPFPSIPLRALIVRPFSRNLCFFSKPCRAAA
jgi:hypothetical protein